MMAAADARRAAGRRLPPAGEVHVTWASLDVGPAEVDRAARLLSPDEAGRAARFVFALHRSRWIAARATLRRVIAAWTGLEPQEVRFAYGANGKPMLFPTGSELRFNLSHSGGYAACAVTSGRDVGIDLEEVRPLADLEAVAAQFFSPVENEALLDLPAAGRLRGFYECWTRKEAFLKATGDGLARPLDSFSVTLGPDQPPRIRHTSPDPEECDRWSLLALDVQRDVLAAVALPRGEWRVRCAQASADFAGGKGD